MTADFTFAHCEEGFDEHIEWSIRGYGNLLSDVINYSRYFVENNTNVVDIGCSTGKTTQKMLEHNQDHCCDANYIGVEIAENFFENLDKRKEECNYSHPWANVEFIKDDIRNFKFENCSLVTSIFTLQFMPKKDRKTVIENIYNGLNEGSAFIFAEKIDCNDTRNQDMMTFNYYDFKRKKFSTNDIMNKERMLRHMLKPNTLDEIKEMLKWSGFYSSQVFWQNHMFIGIIAIK